jgi:hypothetical protein
MPWPTNPPEWMMTEQEKLLRRTEEVRANLESLVKPTRGKAWGVYRIEGETADPATDRLIKVWAWDLQEVASEYCARWNGQDRGRFYVNAIFPAARG